MVAKKTTSLVLDKKHFLSLAIIKNILIVLAGSILIALSAQVVIPMWPVPLSGQTFAVLLVGALLGSRKGTMSVLSYITGGALGLPIFASGGIGAIKLLGPTAGYIYGFVAAAFIAGWLIEHGFGKNIFKLVITFTLANIAIYFFGLIWLTNFTGVKYALTTGLFPFVIGDCIKIILAAICINGINYFAKK